MDNRFSNSDDRLDALLRKRIVKPSADFTEATLKRIRADKTFEMSDDALDSLLAERPVAASADFTERTLHAVRRRDNILTFFRPAFAAAASVAVTLSGIWIYDSATVAENDTDTVGLAAENTTARPVAPADEMTEIRELAAALNDAAPLLDPKAVDTLTLVSNQ
jgi:hypothetical protein